VHTIDLTYIELGIHEQLAAYVADQQNYYEQEGVHVALRDGRAWDGERIRRTATIGLGRAVVSRLTDGIPWTVLCVNTHRPMFWLLARDAYASAEKLKGRRIGVHAPQTAPGCFSRIVLRRLGLDLDHDVQPVVMTPGDHGRHLRRLAEGSLDAAFVGSTLAPEVTAEENSLRVLAYVGDYFRYPTVGVAVDPTHLAPDDPAVLAIVRANRRACARSATSRTSPSSTSTPSSQASTRRRPAGIMNATSHRTSPPTAATTRPSRHRRCRPWRRNWACPWCPTWPPSTARNRPRGPRRSPYAARDPAGLSTQSVSVDRLHMPSALDSLRRLPVPRQQLVEPADRMSVDHALENVAQISVGLDVVDVMKLGSSPDVRS
jgi:NitT/TauT family transport system substrate-binding protein